MDTTDWLLLTKLFEEKNISRTAEILRFSQPAITYRIKKIESELGVEIIQRSRRGIIFTPQGEYIVQYAMRMYKEYIELKEEVLNYENKVQGVLRLSASSIFSRYKLPPILREFNLQYPLVEFHLNTGWSEDVSNAILKDESQIGILRGDYNLPYVKKEIMKEGIYIVSKDEIDIDMLPRLPRTYYNTDTSLKKLIDDWWIENYLTPPINTMQVDNLETCKKMVLNGLGYAIVPSILLNDDDKLFKVQCKNKAGEPVERITWLIYKEEYLNNTVVKAFSDFITNWNFN